MTQREAKIIKDILDVLHESDGQQFLEVLLHAKVCERTKCSLQEFNACLAMINANGWVNCVENRTTRKMKWNINDAGEAARLEM